MTNLALVQGPALMLACRGNYSISLQSLWPNGLNSASRKIAPRLCLEQTALGLVHSRQIRTGILQRDGGRPRVEERRILSP